MTTVDSNKYYVFYDGECGFCNFWVHWILKKDVKDNKIVTKTSIFDNKKYDKFELKLIKIGISIFILSIILVFFYIIFLRKKNSNKVLYISHNILRK